MSFVTDIQTIAKTKILEEKVGKALQQAEIANAKAKANLLGERSTASQNAGVVDSSPNLPPIEQVQFAGSGVVGHPAGFTYPTPPSISAGTGSGGTSVVPSAPNTNNQSENPKASSGGSSGGGATSSTPTDLSGAASSTQGSLGGSNLQSFNTAVTTDPVAAGIVASMTAAGYSPAAIEAAVNAYTQQTYGEAGVPSGSAVANNTPANSTMGNLSPPSLIYGGATQGQQVINGVTGWDPTGTVSPTTGVVQSVGLRFDGYYPSPILEDVLASGGTQAWTAWNEPPPYVGWQFGKIWSINVSGGYASSAEGAMAVEAAYILSLGLFDPSYSNLRPTAGVAPNYTQYQCDLVYYDTPGKDPAHKFDGPNTIIAEYNASVHPASASATQPYYPYLPLTGTYVLSLQQGLWQPSPYDSEASFLSKYTDSSYALIALGDGINVVDNRYMAVQPAVDGGLLMTILQSDKTTPVFANYIDANRVLTVPNIQPTTIPYYLPQ